MIQKDDSMSYEIIRADLDDAEELLNVQKLAYQRQAELYNNFDIPPLRETTAEITGLFITHIFLKAVSQGKIAGTVSATEKDGTCHIGRLSVRPDMQKKGIGSALMCEIEKQFSVRRYALFAGTKSAGNIRLYQKLGYTIYKTEHYGCGDIEIFHMEKMHGLYV